MIAVPHLHPVRVYYEDTDLAGIVYYANYLKFIERARTEFVRALGVDQVEMRDRDGIVFAVRRVEADYLSPARFDDELIVETRPLQVSPARIRLAQDVLRGADRLFASEVELAALGPSGRPARLPAAVRSGLAALLR